MIMAQAEFTGQTYGEATEQKRAQRAVPTGAPPTSVDAQRMASQQQGAPRSPMPQVTPLTAPTERPDEPITAGSPFGPGPNRVSFQARKLVGVDEVEEQLAVLNELYPNEGVALLLARLRERRR